MFKVVSRLAFAAGLLVATQAQAQGPERAYSWTGFYAGIHGGQAWGDQSYTNTGTPSQNFSGGIYGAQLGYNLQTSNIVWGIEADISNGKQKDSVRDGNYIVETGEIGAQGTIRGRLGLAVGRTLPYLTAGYAWARVTQGESCPADPAAVVAGFCKTHGPFNLSGTNTQSGFVWGGGVEHAISHNWSLRLEGLHTVYRASTYILGPDATAAPLPPSEAHLKTTQIRVGINYRF